MFFNNRKLVHLKSIEEIDVMKQGATILAQVHGLISRMIAPGVTALELDKAAHDFISKHHAKPSFLNFNGFPNTLCVSINETVVHGIPDNRTLKDGDIISVDCGVYFKGFHTDSAYTYTVGNVANETKQLLTATLQSLYKGIEKVRVGNRMGDVSFAIQQHVESKGYSVVRELVGHGVGKQLHESPEVPNYGRRGQGIVLQKGMVLAIEPMINLGKRDVYQESDGWTIKTVDHMPSAHFEHTVAVWKENPIVITSFEFIDEKFKYI